MRTPILAALAAAFLLTFFAGCGAPLNIVAAQTNGVGLLDGDYTVTVRKPAAGNGNETPITFTMVVAGNTGRFDADGNGSIDTGTFTGNRGGTVTLTFFAGTGSQVVYRFLPLSTTALELGTSSRAAHSGAVITAVRVGGTQPDDGAVGTGGFQGRSFRFAFVADDNRADPNNVRLDGGATTVSNNRFDTDIGANERYDDRSDSAATDGGVENADDGTVRQQDGIVVFTANNGDTYVGLARANGGLVVALVRGTYTRADDSGGRLSAEVVLGPPDLDKLRASN